MISAAQLEETDDPWPFIRELDIQDKRMMSVTGILRRSGMIRFHVSKAQLQQLASAGKDVHLVCEDIARREVSDYWTDLPDVAPYARAFAKFCKDFDFRPELIEERLEHPFMGYLGRLDMAGPIFAESRSRSRFALIDVKRCAPAPSHVYQTAGYAELIRARIKTVSAIDRLCVYLRPEKYFLRRHEERNDFAHFSALLTVARLREAAGLISERDETAFDELIRQADSAYNGPRL